MLLSIIIPAYNVEKFLSKCLDSCLRQDVPITTYEIIIINDGSLDNTFLIATDYAKIYSNISVISQENKGLSVARNAGALQAKGDYVWFVDSDDWIEENCLSKIFTKLIGADLVQIQYRYTFDNPIWNKDEKIYIDEKKSGQEILLQGCLPAPVQFTIYRRKFLQENNLYFVPGIYHEDSEFKPRAVYFAKSVALVNDICYNYYQRTSGSITSSFKIKNAKDIIYVMNSIHKFSKDKEWKYRRAFYGLIGLSMNSLLFNFRTLKDVEQLDIKTQLSSEKHLFKAMRKSNKIKYIIEGSIFSISIDLGLKLHNIFR